jgi:PPOX class probable F420-dependent enzyme
MEAKAICYAPTTEQLSFIDSCRVAHLATADSDGCPHVVPVCFAYLDGAFWIAIDEKPKTTGRLKRIRNIETNPRVSLVFDRYDEDWFRLAYVLVNGSAEVFDAAPAPVVDALRERYEQYRTMRLEGRPVIKITPERVVAWGELG